MACKVRVKLFFHYQKYGPDGRGDFELELPPKTPVSRVLDGLGLPKEVKVVLLNGRQAKVGSEIQDGDLLVVFPPVEGG